VVRERYDRLVALVEEITLAENERLVGREVEVLVAEGEGRKDSVTRRMSGRARDNRLVHFAPADTSPRPGDVVSTVVSRAAPHHLIADGTPGSVRRTRGGDAWQARQEDAAQGWEAGTAGQGREAGTAGRGREAGTAGRGEVMLGMPARPRAARSG
jgi:tRNA-2-methylthio-N6-dimethylallyladenosine synthase